MSKLKLFLLGTPQLEIDGAPIELERRKAMALLAYLVVAGKSQSRDSLAALLWPEADQGRARTSLRHNLYTLNKALGDGLLEISRETIGIDPNPNLWVDVNQFWHELAACHRHDHAAAAVCPDCLPHLREAAALYRNDFMTGFSLRDSPEFDEWQRFQTEKLRRELTETLERLVRGQSTREDFKAAIPFAQRWLALDPLHEPAHRQLMELYARAGQRAAALHQYGECERILQEELGVRPSMETTALAERIRLEAAGQQGQLIRSYELQELIGAGGFGEVYRAYQPQVRREVAIKVILPHFANQPEFIRRFEAEAHMVAQLEHPHIVPLYDYWREPNGAYLVMRWLRGGSLEDALKAGPWSPEATAQLLDQIAAALLLAHQRGIIHRDLKPANILLDEGGNSYLTDFGIAKAVTAPWSASQTQADVILGSPAYMAPEAANDEPLTPQTDVYSLGVMLFEMLTGQHPFPDTTPPMMLVKHLSEPLPPLQLPNPDLSAALNEVIQRATAKKPADRYADTISLATDFRRVLGSDQVAVTALPDESTPLLVPNPYKGLHAFQEGDAADFFGREVLVEQLLMRLVLNLPTKRQPSIPSGPYVSQRPQSPRLQNFLAVVGPSGSGKSSLVKAGLIPVLRQNAIPGSKDWFIVEMTPGSHPLEELESALLRIAINPPPVLLDLLQADERGLVRAVKRILPDDESELLLVIDQFEEIFTLVADEAARAHLLDSLHAAVTDPESRLRVVITLRADFYDRPLLYPGFGDLLRQRMETVLPLSNEELEQAIAGPAERVGATFETGLIPIIVSDVQEQPGTLPLMQYALTELFERRQGRRLTLDAYQASGGVFGALARRADELYTELDDAGRVATRRLFLRLVTLGEGVEETRRRVLRSELAAPDGRGEESGQFETNGALMNSIIDTFGQYRLLTFDRDPVTRGPTVEVAHEALIREWDRLRQWLDEDREFLMWQQRLRAGLHQWEANEQDEGALLRGAPLAEAENWLKQRRTDLNEAEREFIQASQALQEHQVAEREAQRQRDLETAQKLAKTESRAAQRLRWLAVGLVIFLIVVAGLAVFAFNQRAEAEANLVQAETNLALSESQRLAAQASAILQSDGDPELAALLSLRALNTAYTAQADITLQQASKGDYGRRLFTGHSAGVEGLAFSPDGRFVLSGSQDNTARLWDVETGQEIQTLVGHTAGIRNVAYSPDGKYLLTGSADSTARLWDAQTGQQLYTLSGHTGEVNGVAFSADGQYALTGGWEGTVRFWDVETGQQIRILTEDEGIYELALSPDGKYILTGNAATGKVRLSETATGLEADHLTGLNTAGTNTVTFSPDGRYVLAGHENGGLYIWDLQQAEAEPRISSGHTEWIYEVRVSPDGKYALSAGHDGTARLWDIQTGEEVRRFISTNHVTSIAWSPDSQMMVVGERDGNIRLWDVEPPPDPRTFGGHTNVVAAAKFSPDGRYVLTGSLDQTAKLWDAATGQEQHVLRGHTDQVFGVAFSPDSRYALTGSSDKTARLWEVETGQEARIFTHPAEVFGVAFSPDGRYALTSSSDKTARLWEVDTGREVRVFTHPAEVFGVAFAPDGRYILTGSPIDGTTRLWEVETGREVRQFPGYTDFVNGLSFSPDGKYIITAADATTGQVWDVETGQALDRFPGDVGRFSPDGKYLLTGGLKTANLWDSTTGEQLRAFSVANNLWSVELSPDGQFILIGGSDQFAQLWDADYQTLVDSVCARVLRDFTDEEREKYGIHGEYSTCPPLN